MTYEPTDGDPELAEVIRDHLEAVKASRQAERADRYRELLGLLHGPPMTAGDRLAAARHLGRDIGE